MCDDVIFCSVLINKILNISTALIFLVVSNDPVCTSLVLLVFFILNCIYTLWAYCNVPFVYPTLLSYRGQGSSAALHMVEYTGGRVSLPSRM